MYCGFNIIISPEHQNEKQCMHGFKIVILNHAWIYKSGEGLH